MSFLRPTSAPLSIRLLRTRRYALAGCGFALVSGSFASQLPAQSATFAAGMQTVAGQPVVVQPGAPGSPSRTLPSSTRPVSPRLADEDIRFMQGMIMHHTQAVAMTALIPSHTNNQQIRLLGERISASQSDEMNFMKRWLVARGEPVSMAMPGMPEMDMSGAPMPSMPGMLTSAQMTALAAARGPQFDRLFLTGMTQHHNGALVMVKDLFATEGAGQDADLFNFATDADNTQRAEINIMQGLLAAQTAQGSGQPMTPQPAR